VIAGNEDHFFTVPRTAQNLLHDRVLHFRPLDAAPHRPEIDYVAQQKQIVALEFAQEVEKPVCLATASAQMDVGQEY
jgi:hypothetical protein